MTPIEQATAFVNRYPAMFTEDKEFWSKIIAIELIEAQKSYIKKLKEKLAEGK